MNPFGVPETDVLTVAARREQGDDFILLDVREATELQIANLGADVLHLPLSQLVAEQLAAIPPELADKAQEIVVMCHHGSRSAQVAAYLRANGWTNVVNLQGGIHAWAMTVDPSLARY